MKVFGWHFLAKEIADYTNTTFFEIMNTSAIEVAGFALLIKYKTRYNELLNNA